MGAVRHAAVTHAASNRTATTSIPVGSPETWIPFQLIGGIAFATMAFILFTAVSYQCAATLRWLKGAILGRDPQMPESAGPITKQSPVRISHSLPDLHSLPAESRCVQGKEGKKVLRQTTLPTVPARHQTFQRSLTHRLDVPFIQFSICRFENRSDSSLGLIKPELYASEKERADSADSSATGELEYCGKLHLALRYDAELEGLVVKVLEARDLPIKDVTGSSDPYIKVYLLPDRKKKFQTKVHRKNLNPIFNEIFIFSVNYEDLHRRYLQFSVYDFDRFSRHDLIGQVVLKGLLDATDLHQEIEYTMNILSPPQEKKDLGELMLSLCYLPKAGRLTLTVIKARNLRAKDINGKSDPYVKVYLLYEEKRIKKKKTTVKKSTLCPVYEEALIFDVPSEDIEDVCLLVKVLDHDMAMRNEREQQRGQEESPTVEISVERRQSVASRDDPDPGPKGSVRFVTAGHERVARFFQRYAQARSKGRIGGNELLGCTAIGNAFIGAGRDHWLEMLDNPRKPVAQWYTLLDSVPGHASGSSKNPAMSLSCLNAR